MIRVAPCAGESHLQKLAGHVHAHEVALRLVASKERGDGRRGFARLLHGPESPVRQDLVFVRLHQQHALLAATNPVQIRPPPEIQILIIQRVVELAHSVSARHTGRDRPDLRTRLPEERPMARFVAILLMVTLAGCGRESPESQTTAVASKPAEAAPAAQPQDACTLLTDEEFRQATGFAPANKKSFPGENPGCEWQYKTDASTAGVYRISVIIKPSGGRERFDFMASGSLKKIPEVGDGAVQTGGNMDGTVWAVTGDALVTLRYSLPLTTPDANPVVLPLLKALLSRL
jgi:hypothetical protein